MSARTPPRATTGVTRGTRGRYVRLYPKSFNRRFHAELGFFVFVVFCLFVFVVVFLCGFVVVVLLLVVVVLVVVVWVFSHCGISHVILCLD